MTNTQTLSAPKHRHFVAVPMVLAALMVTWGSVAGISLGGSVQERPAQVLRLLGGSAQGTGLSVRDDTLQLATNGSALIRAEGNVGVLSDGISLRVTNGLAQVWRDADSLAVKAISAPVLVSIAGEPVLVPAGMQWRWNGQELPTLDDGLMNWWLARQPVDLTANDDIDALTLSGASLPGAIALADGTLVPTDWQRLVALPAAKHRLDEAQASIALGDLEEKLQLGDTVAASDLLTKAESLSVFETATAQARLPLFLEESAGMPTVFSRLIVRQAATPEGWFMLPFLPEASRFALLPDQPNETPLELRLLQALLVPLSDRRPEALSVLVNRQWADSLLPIAGELDQPEVFRQLLRDELKTVIARAQANGWTERAERYELSVPADTE